MWQYKVREKADGIDIAGASGYPDRQSAIKAFKRRFAQWQKYHCTIYTPDYQPCSEKHAGERSFL